MRHHRPIESTEVSTAAARSQLAQLLACTTDEKLATFTVDQLARMNRTPRGEIAAMLYEAQRARRAYG